ncbi:hypothetical protein [Paraburkholderia tagetis]|uniref:Uncharacterized protein n=1 Tax=Paraburkholderia tagetis TaxID=2913261 RepID=A0A9X1UIT3_9BURK|nr:hypothetical protein [Paraburkholderia tagetis]MCG5075803.1 hypothetical protein [Paraburkholderia tagetis]
MSYDERQKKRKEREEQIDQNRRDFDRLFRVSISRRDARASSDFNAYAAFIREHLRISGLSAPIDGDGVTRILRDAVRDGWLIPAIDHAWRGSRRVARSYAPQSWPKRVPDPKPTVYGVRDGQFIPLDEGGRFIERTPYRPVVAIASKAASSNGASGWLDAVGSAAGALLGGGDDSHGAITKRNFFDSGDSGSTPLGDAQPFDYTPDTLIDDVQEFAARGVGMSGNEPGGFRVNPNGLDVDYFDTSGNLCAQYHASHGESHGHNFFDGKRDNAHLPMSPINCE